MAKPRIIIADTDISYIIPLQLKFVEDFFEKVDLEIISDTEYFDTLFSTPQRADILIISDELYSQSMRRHNISHIFVMNEQYEEEQTADLNVNHIFKYTSIKEIFNEITGKSADVLKIENNGKQETQTILFYSASGGAGKTTVAMGVSACGQIIRCERAYESLSAFKTTVSQSQEDFHSINTNKSSILSDVANVKKNSITAQRYYTGMQNIFSGIGSKIIGVVYSVLIGSISAKLRSYSNSVNNYEDDIALYDRKIAEIDRQIEAAEKAEELAKLAMGGGQ